VRLMAPFSMRCDTCGEYIYKGKKFNARKETVEGDEYLGIKIFRFYIRCPKCSAEITFKTDPKNADYVAEHGVARNFESWRDEKFATEEASFRKQMEEERDPMKALENRTQDSKREIDILDALDEIRTRNAKIERVDADSVLNKIFEEKDEISAEPINKELADSIEDEQIAKSIFESADGVRVKRLREDQGGDERTTTLRKQADSLVLAAPVLNSKRTKLDSSVLGIVKKARQPAVSKSSSLSLLTTYEDNSE
jgi:hypothetical protein